MSLTAPRAGARALALAFLATAGCAASASAAEKTVTYVSDGSSQSQSWVVPTGITEVGVVAVGGKGGSGMLNSNRQLGAPGGWGARVEGTLAVTPGQTLYLVPGGSGLDGCEPIFGTGGGFNGGGDGGTSGCRGGGGGGASDIRLCASDADSCDAADDPLGRILVAAGGGGGGSSYEELTGTGGNAEQTGGSTSSPRGTAGGGTAGTASAGGTGGSRGDTGFDGEPSPSTDGALATGGTGGTGHVGGLTGGGGGGGGLYGGGGGGSANYYGGGGGGGSNLVPDGFTASVDDSATPRIELTFAVGPPATVSAPTFNPATLPADGRAETTASVTVRDDHGTTLDDLTVTFTSTDSGQSIGAAVAEGDGKYTATIGASTTPGTPTITATVTGTEVSNHAQLRLLAPPAVTSPADGTPVLDSLDGPGTVTVAGTADVEAVNVDLYCFNDGSYTSLDSDVPVTDGTWTAEDVELPEGTGPEAPCRLTAAVAGFDPNGTPGVPQGPRLRRLALSVDDFGTGARAYDAYAVGLEGAVRIWTLGGCGMALETYRPDPAFDRTQLSCAGGGLESEPYDVSADEEAPAFAVDGHPAFTPDLVLRGNAIDDSYDADDRPELNLTPSLAEDGSLVVTEESRLARCTGSDDIAPGDMDECGGFADSGIAVTVTTTVSPEGTHVRRELAFRSTDGQPHAFAFTLGQQPDSEDVEFRLPGATGFTPAVEGGAIAWPADPQTIVVRSTDDPETDPSVYVTASTAPIRARFGEEGLIVTRYTRAVPATGSARLAFTYETTTDADEGDLAATAARGGYTPSVNVTSPETGTVTEAATAVVTGASDDENGPMTVTVAGEDVAVAEDGTWSHEVALTEGENTIPVVGTNVYGTIDEDSVTITRVTPDTGGGEGGGGGGSNGGGSNGGGSGGGTTTTTTTPPPTATNPAPKPPVANPPASPSPLGAVTVGSKFTLRAITTSGVPAKIAVSVAGSTVTGELLGPSGLMAKNAVLGRVVVKKAKRGTLRITVKPSKKAAKALKKRKKVVLTLRITVKPPNGGKARTVSRKLTVRR